MAHNLGFWNPQSGYYIQVDGYAGAYSGTYNLDAQNLDWEYDPPNEFAWQEQYVWPMEVYNAKITDPTRRGDMKNPEWTWSLGYWDFDPAQEPPDQYIEVASGTAHGIYFSRAGEYDESTSSEA